MNWYALNTKPHCEFKAIDYYSKLGIESYVPSIKNHNSKGKLSGSKPAISGYIFLALLELDYDLINLNPYTKSLVRRFGKPAIIKEEEVHIMQQCLGERSFEISKDGNFEINNFMPGKSVSIETGILKGNKGLIIEVRNGCLFIFLDALQAYVNLSIKNQKVLTY